MSIALRLLEGGIGAEVVDFDIRTMAPEDAGPLNAAFLEHHILLVRDQRASDDDLCAFGACFGALEMARLESPLAKRREIMVISNIRENGQTLGQLPDGELVWHFDRMHQPVPNKAGVLLSVEIPSRGGETLFADMCRAYEALPLSLKQKLEGLTALNTFSYGATQAEKKDAMAGPHAIHPAVRRLPETHKKAIFVCRLMTDRLNELAAAESRELLDRVFDHCEDAKFTYTHSWRTGDILIWDNRCTMHARNDFPDEERRLMKRVTVGDTLPPEG